MVEHGEELFADIGCTSCHVPEMVLSSRNFVEPNPYQPAGHLCQCARTAVPTTPST